jgi:hypothetical protein
VGVKKPTAARLAWSLCAGCIAGICGLVVLKVLNGATDLRSMPLVAAPLAFCVVGALVASRQQRNPVGWQLLAVGVFMTANLAGESYARYALLTAPGSLPGGLYGAWLGWSYAPIVAILAIFLPLYFPTGRLLSPRWRPVLWLGVGFLVLAVAGNALWPGPDELLQGVGPVRNPVVFLPSAKPLLELLQSLAGLCLLPGIGGAIAAIVIRFRRSHGIERQQLKWFTYAAVLAPLPPLAYNVDPRVFLLLRPVIFPLVPISVGVAILRYRLYEIDRIINRTLVYGLLTALLAAVYAAVVLVLGQLFGGLSAQPPTWAVAGATLAVAALFQPARRRIQQAVDRRFNRRKYNAAKTIQAYSVRLRDQLDLDTLSAELLAVVDQTMQPTRVSLWLRPPTHGSSGTAGSEARPTTWAY